MNSAKKTEPMSPAPRRRRNRRSERERDDLSEGGSLAEEKDVAGVRAAAEEDEREPELVLRFTVVPAEVKLTLCKSSARSSTHGSISDPINEEREREREMWQWRREEVSCEILPRNRIIRRYKNDVYGNGKGCNLGVRYAPLCN